MIQFLNSKKEGCEAFIPMRVSQALELIEKLSGAFALTFPDVVARYFPVFKCLKRELVIMRIFSFILVLQSVKNKYLHNFSFFSCSSRF